MAGGGAGPSGDRTDVRSFVRSDGRSFGRTENLPLCSIGHRPLRVRCPKRNKEKGESRITNHESRITNDESRITNHVKKKRHKKRHFGHHPFPATHLHFYLCFKLMG